MQSKNSAFELHFHIVWYFEHFMLKALERTKGIFFISYIILLPERNSKQLFYLFYAQPEHALPRLNGWIVFYVVCLFYFVFSFFLFFFLSISLLPTDLHLNQQD